MSDTNEFALPVSHGEVFSVDGESIAVVIDPFRPCNSTEAWLARHVEGTYLWVSESIYLSLADEDTRHETWKSLQIKETDFR